MILGGKNIQPDARALALLLNRGNATTLADCVRCVPNRCIYGGDGAGENATDVAFANVAFGYGAMQTGKFVSYCVAVGYAAGNAMDFAGALHNVMVGPHAGISCTNGSYNAYLGGNAGYWNTTGDYNTCVGQVAGSGAAGSATYRYCTYLGQRAGSATSSGDYNTGCGALALDNVTSGEKNAALGYQAGGGITTVDGCVFLGHQAGANNLTADRLYIDNTNAARPLIFGEFGNDNVGINANAFAGGQGVLALYNASTNPVGGVANSAIFYVSAGEMWVQDSAGNNTQLSSHRDGRWIHRSRNERREIVVDMELLVTLVEVLTGTRIMEVRDVQG